GFESDTLLKGNKGHRLRSKSITELKSPVDITNISDLKASETSEPTLHPISPHTTFTGTVEKLYNLIMTSGFVKRFIVEVEKCTEVEIGEWETKDGKLRRSSSFIKPLNFSIGPKSTKCYIEDECLHKSFD
ncbi:2967_t:CDS:2, partial [Scutellospora calospora]